MSDNDFISKANSIKAKSGSDWSSTITKCLDELKKESIIKSYLKDQNFERVGYNYKYAYFANFVITTNHNKRIIVNSSNSFRSDRAKIGFYDLEGIRRHSNFKDKIEALVYLVGKSDPLFRATKRRIRDKVQYCPATHLFELDEFIQFLSNFEYQVISEKELLAENGSMVGRRGNEFEKIVVELLNNNEYLRQYRQGLKVDKLFSLIIDKIRLDHSISREDIGSIKSTNTIPLLNSGGNPKTDIHIRLFLPNQQSVLSETVSIKTTSKSQVSCHDYKAEDYVRVLGCQNTELEFYLNHFQEYPSKKDFVKFLPKEYTFQSFIEILGKYENILYEWAMRGMHDKENILFNDVHISNYLLLNNLKKYRFVSISDYREELIKASKGSFNTLFNWTYPSKQRGKRIQLKLPVII